MKKIIIMILAIACMITVLNSCRDKTGEEVMNTEESEPPTEAPSETEAETEPTTEPATESLTEAPTEAPTEALPEPPTEAPTEAPTETPTEPEMEFTIKGRETMLEGQPVEFDILSRDFGGTSKKFDIINSKASVIPIKGGDDFDYRRRFIILSGRTFEEFSSNMKILDRDNYMLNEPEFQRYNKSYFKDKAVIILCQGGGVKRLVKNGAELCIGAETRLNKPDDIRPAVIEFPIQFIEIEKAVLDGIDTISFYVEALS